MSFQELINILMSDRPSEEIKKNEEKVFLMIPELEKCKGFKQNNEWHIYDVYEHILKVVDLVPNIEALRLAALFHDIGKPSTYTEDEEKIGHFYGHWEVSKEVFNKFSIKYKLNKEISNLVSNLVLYHDINISKLDEEGIKKLINIFNSKEIDMLYELKKADLLAQNQKFHHLIDNFKNEKEKILKKEVN